MAALASRPDVGAVGAKLFYPDGRIQHAGIVLGLGPHGVAGHEFRGAPGESPGPQNRLLLDREVSAVTAACMVVDRERFVAVGGFDESALAVAFNDVDLCLKLAARGWRTMWTAQARLMHLESASRGADRAAEAAERLGREAAAMRERWGDLLTRDPRYNPNLTLSDESFTLADRSRAGAP
jgi:GT2 family glycosyltransferase